MSKKGVKKGAIELSISTVVIIVLAMSMLVLGLILIRNIFKGATESVNILDKKVQNAIAGMFNEENSGDVVVYLSPDRNFYIKPNSEVVSIAVGFRTPDGSPNADKIKYKILLGESTDKDCRKIIGETATKQLFDTPLDREMTLPKLFESNTLGGGSIKVKAVKGTTSCTQELLVEGYYYGDTGKILLGRDYINVNVMKPNILGF